MVDKAWATINATWRPRARDKTEVSTALRNVRKALRKLQQLRLPAAATVEIENLISAVIQHTAETTFCPECGIRGDETAECDRCHARVDAAELCGGIGLCDVCQQEDEDQEDERKSKR